MGRVEIRDLLTVFFQDAKKNVAKFNKQSYAYQMEELCKKYAHLFNAIENYYHLENDNLEVLKDLATVFVEIPTKELAELSKRKKSMAMLEYNMTMVTYVLPCISNQKESYVENFAQYCVDNWNQVFFENKIENATQEHIQGGFKKGICYITTAVCQSMNLDDNCYELNMLRNYRDTYILNETANGADIIKKYYDIAPTIVKHIDKLEDADAIYTSIWEKYLSPCISLIEANQKEESKKLYIEMVENLEHKYFYS